MAILQIGNELGLAICKALGLDSKHVLDVSIRCRPGELAEVTLIRALDRTEAGELMAAMEGYCIERKPEDPAAQAMETVARNLMKADGGRAVGWP